MPVAADAADGLDGMGHPHPIAVSVRAEFAVGGHVVVGKTGEGGERQQPQEKELKIEPHGLNSTPDKAGRGRVSHSVRRGFTPEGQGRELKVRNSRSERPTSGNHWRGLGSPPASGIVFKTGAIVHAVGCRLSFDFFQLCSEILFKLFEGWNDPSIFWSVEYP